MANAYSATSYLNYDALGRVVQSSQATAGQAYSFSYGYDLMGSLTSETYPSGRVITTQYDAAERVSSVAGALTSLQKNYLSSITYAPHGAMAAMQMGNNVWRVYSYNSRLQVQRIEDAVNNDPSQVLLDQQFTWGTNDNNGNLQSVVTNHGGPGYQQPVTFKEYYGYDQLNRVLGSYGKDINENLLWGQNFSYDRYGNAWTPSTGGLPVSGLTPTTNVYNTANRMNATTYDAAGNQTVVGAYALVYDAENRQKQSTDSTTGAIVGYQYDGDGRRVEKTLGDNDTVYVYDAFGQLAAEYTNGSAGTLPCQTCYLSTDHLGNTRLVTDGSANVIARHDFTPFGEEIPAGYAARTTQWGAFDGVRQKFTGQEHDEETQFDFFQTRYPSSAQQRFLSPDPANAGADPFNPQSWNAYAYVNNNPLNATDPTGMFISLVPPKDNGDGDDGGYDSGDPCFLCFLPRCILCFGPGGGAPASEPPSPPVKFTVTATANSDKNDVTKKSFACSADVAINFGLGFIPGYNGIKAVAAFAGMNFNPVEATLKYKGIITAGPVPIQAAAGATSFYSIGRAIVSGQLLSVKTGPGVCRRSIWWNRDQRLIRTRQGCHRRKLLRLRRACSRTVQVYLRIRPVFRVFRLFRGPRNRNLVRSSGAGRAGSGGLCRGQSGSTRWS